VLEEARDPAVPRWQRIKFPEQLQLSNLYEFFMIRVRGRESPEFLPAWKTLCARWHAAGTQ